MNVCVALEHRFSRLPDGSVWTQGPFGERFWRRYLDVFDRVRCIARVRDVERLAGEWNRADGPAVSVVPVPYYVGAGEFVRQALRVYRTVQMALTPGDAFVLRVPGLLSSIASHQLDARGYPYGVEVLGDPQEAFAPDAVRHPLRRLIRWSLPLQLRRQCARAAAACYVTERTLQCIYPSQAASFFASSAELPDDVFVREPRIVSGAVPLKLVFVGTLEQYYKGQDVLLRAVSQCVAQGVDVQLTMVGDGRHRRELEELASALGCGERVTFAGHLPAGDRVYAELDAADLFVLPSRSEGLPRAMLEAMARGLPCIGSDVGGIPEVLSPEAIVPAGNVQKLAEKIRQAADPLWRRRMSEINLERVRAFRSAALREQRIRFYTAVRESTDRWLAARSLLVGACF